METFFGSTGSVVPIFEELTKQNKPLTVRNPKMTRFFMSVNNAVELVLDALKFGHNKELWVYKNKSCTIKEIANLFTSNQVITGTENIEKTNEALLTVHELKHSNELEDYYIVRKDYISDKKYDKPLTSDNAERLTIKELHKMLEEWRYNE